MTEPCDLGDPRVSRGPDPLGQPCATCKWGQFQMTKHTPPRINPKLYGQCTWPMPPMIAVARCITSITTHNAHRSVVWPKDKGCPVWESK